MIGTVDKLSFLPLGVHRITSISTLALTLLILASVLFGLLAILFAVIIFKTKKRHTHNQKENSITQYQGRMQNVIKLVASGSWEYHVKHNTMKLSQEYCKLQGSEKHEDICNLEQFINLIHPDDQGKFKDSIHGLINGQYDTDYQELRIKSPKEGWQWVECMRFVEERDTLGHAKVVLGHSINVNERKSFEMEDIIRRDREQLMQKAAGAGYWECDNKRQTVTLSSSAGKIFLEEDREVSMPLHELLPKLSSSSSTELMLHMAQGHAHENHEFSLQLKIETGSMQTKYIKTHFHRIFNEDDELVRTMAMSIDITEQVMRERKESYLARHDELTGLYNRRDFEEKVAEGGIQTPYILILCDLDGLKLINDTAGHKEGDVAIEMTAMALRSSFPDGYAARIGGDEFAVIIPGEDGEVARQGMIRVMEYFQKNNPLYLDVDISSGYAVVYHHSEYKKKFIKADSELYHYKLSRRIERKKHAKEKLLNRMYLATGESGSHGDRVGIMTNEILKVMGCVRKQDEKTARTLGQLHDMGKLTIPVDILLKPGKLTEKEWEVMRTHPEAGFKIVSNLIDETEVAESVLYHHENWDGSGYPYGKKGEDIPLLARVLAVANAYDDMTQKLPHRDPMGHEKACEELKKNAGKQFDPEVVEAFMKYMSMDDVKEA